MTLPESNVFVSPEWLSKHGSEVTVIDVRDRRDFVDLGHVPAARNIPFKELRDPSSVADGRLPDPDDFADLMAAAGVAPTDTLVAYDGDRGVYAARFLLIAEVYGHAGDLHLLDGEYAVWQAFHETTTDRALPESTSYETDQSSEALLADRSEVKAAIESDAILVDTRTGAEYAQSHIPGAVHLNWEAFVDEETRRLKPRTDLRDLLADRGIRRDQPIVLYCNTARRLSYTFAVLRHLGYPDVRFYEGSLTDWVRANAPSWSPEDLQQSVRSLASGGLDRILATHGEDVLDRLKLVGLYEQTQDDYFMLRTKVPGGVLTAAQADVIGTVADEFARAPPTHGGSEQNPVFGDAYLDVTTRQDVQMHWIDIEDVPEIWDRYEAVGLTTLQGCGNSVRNVVSCPAAGLDPAETIDVRPLADAITEHFAGDRTYANLPRKLKVSLAGCPENCGRAQINDLGFTPARKDGADGFHVRIGGGLSDGPRLASDLNVFLEPEQVLEFVEATADLFIERGSYLDTAVNRLRFLVEELGEDRIREDLADRVSFDLRPGGESLTRTYRGDHVGVHEQADDRVYMGLAVPTGRMLGAEFAQLAELSRQYGAGELRLTPNQNVLLPHVEPDDVAALRETSILDRYSPEPGPFTRGIVTCTGSEFCSYAIIETKTRAIRWARRLDRWAETELEATPEVVRVHMSGCSASCAQPQIADVGLRGETRREAGVGSREAVDVGLGGDLGRETFLDWYAGAVPIDAIPEIVRRVTERYVAESDPTQASVADWLAGKPDGERARLLAPRGEVS